jgi:uncharacterized protein
MRKYILWMIVLILSLSLMASITLIGCKDTSDEAIDDAMEAALEKEATEEVDKTTEETTVEEAEEEPIEEEAEEETEEEPALEENTPPEGEVTFKTEDGIDIGGNIFGTGKKWVILSHMYPTDQTSWFDFARELADKGYIVLTYDFRGYGKSDGDQDIPNIYKDTEAALNFVKQYDAEKIFLIGASMGGAASLIVASKEEVDGVISFSSAIEFMGLSAMDNIKDIQSPKLFMASQGDAGATEAANIFYEISSGSKYLTILNGNSHGTFIFQEEPENAEIAKQNMFDFLDFS